MTRLIDGAMIRPAVVYRFFAFNAHDPRALGRLLGIFLRGLVGAVAVAAVLGALVAAGMWFISTLGRAQKRGGPSPH